MTYQPPWGLNRNPTSDTSLSRVLRHHSHTGSMTPAGNRTQIRAAAAVRRGLGVVSAACPEPRPGTAAEQAVSSRYETQVAIRLGCGRRGGHLVRGW